MTATRVTGGLTNALFGRRGQGLGFSSIGANRWRFSVERASECGPSNGDDDDDEDDGTFRRRRENAVPRVVFVNFLRRAQRERERDARVECVIRKQ